MEILYSSSTRRKMWEIMQEGKSYKGNLKLSQVTTVLLIRLRVCD